MQTIQDMMLVLMKKRSRYVDTKFKAIKEQDINTIIWCDKNIESIDELMKEIRELYMKDKEE